MSSVIFHDYFVEYPVFNGEPEAHLKILLKSFIVLSAWILGYFGIKHLPLTIAGPIGATRPVMVLVGALLIFGERLNLMQWGGVILGFVSLFFISLVGRKEGISAKNSKWLWFCIGSTICGAVSALYDKHLLKQFEPLQVQAWYSLYQFIIMGITIWIIKKAQPAAKATPFPFRWTIPCIAISLPISALASFYALSLDGAMISVISMIRRGSVLVSFAYGLIFLREKNFKLKSIYLSILLLGLLLFVLGSN